LVPTNSSTIASNQRTGVREVLADRNTTMVLSNVRQVRRVEQLAVPPL
jgi:hypothetical protein